MQIKEAIAAIDVDGDLIKVSLSSGETFVTPKVYLFAGAQNGEILEQSLARDHGMNRELDVPEFDNTYITAISTVRYNHVNHPARPREGSGHVVTPITLGQLEIPGLIDFQANFSIVAEEYGDVLKTRLNARPDRARGPAAAGPKANLPAAQAATPTAIAVFAARGTLSSTISVLLQVIKLQVSSRAVEMI